MPGLNRSESRNDNVDAITSTSSDSEPLASAPSYDSRGRTKDRDPTRRPRTSHPTNNHSKAVKSGYHVFTAFGKEFCVEQRWKFLRELGSGAYGYVVSVQDEITGEILAVKMMTRVLEKIQLAKRALREITLLQHFNNHENIVGLIDMDVSGPDFSEVYLFMEPMDADLYQIIRSGQSLTNAHNQFFMYQLLRGLKYIHSADVVHRDLKPGNLLVNSDCELKICDMGLSRGFNSKPRHNDPSNLTEYVATRWYRAPEIMLSFRRYDTAIDMWSVGCILGELLGGQPVFKGKDYVDQLNQILQILGTPSEETMNRIGSPKAKGYIRAFPIRKATPWRQIFPEADPLCIDLLGKLLTFDPKDRFSVDEALAHPWLASFHSLNDCLDGPPKFGKWQFVEELETTEQFREALYQEVVNFRQEVRSLALEVAAESLDLENAGESVQPARNGSSGADMPQRVPFPRSESADENAADVPCAIPPRASISRYATDPYRAYSISKRTSVFSLHERTASGPPTGDVLDEGSLDRSYPFPSRSRIQSSDAIGGVSAPPPARLIRHLSTVSITGLTDATKANGVAVNGGVVPDSIARAADAPASELPSEWARERTARRSQGSSA